MKRIAFPIAFIFLAGCAPTPPAAPVENKEPEPPAPVVEENLPPV